MTGDSDSELAREAARIFLKLQDNPEDVQAKRKQDAFVARGAAEREAYERVTAAWTAARKKTGPKGRTMIAALLAMGVATFAAYDPLRIRLTADVRTGSETVTYALASGDESVLDAKTALVDETDGAARVVRLLNGGAFFDVGKMERPFRVIAGDLTVEVKGTAFEVTRLDESIQVAVAEGLVDVQVAGQSRLLEPGDTIHVSAAGLGAVFETEVSMVAAWRENRLRTDGMTMADVVEVIDRRLPGKIVILSNALGGQQVTGRLDLSDPMQALRTVAAARNATVTTYIPGLVLLRDAN